MKQLIIYDLDGTLVDTLEDITCAANHMLRMLQTPGVLAREVRGYIGCGVQELVKRCVKTEDPKRIEYGVSVYRAYYARHMLDQSRLYPGAQAVLDYFKARRQAVITNKPNPFSREILTALGVADYFFEIIAGDSAYPKKPDPAAALAIMQQAGSHPEETLLIGDSPIDIETGRRAGVATVGILHGFSDKDELLAAAPDLLVRDFAELLQRAKAEVW